MNNAALPRILSFMNNPGYQHCFRLRLKKHLLETGVIRVTLHAIISIVLTAPHATRII
jgi:hypothetical protein